MKTFKFLVPQAPKEERKQFVSYLRIVRASQLNLDFDYTRIVLSFNSGWHRSFAYHLDYIKSD